MKGVWQNQLKWKAKIFSLLRRGNLIRIIRSQLIGHEVITHFCKFIHCLATVVKAEGLLASMASSSTILPLGMLPVTSRPAAMNNPMATLYAIELKEEVKYRNNTDIHC